MTTLCFCYMQISVPCPQILAYVIKALISSSKRYMDMPKKIYI
jgi:hypothetical protein